jgi:hypothetical protein
LPAPLALADFLAPPQARFSDLPALDEADLCEPQHSMQIVGMFRPHLDEPEPTPLGVQCGLHCRHRLCCGVRDRWTHVVKELAHDDDGIALLIGFEGTGVKYVAITLAAERDDSVMDDTPVAVWHRIPLRSTTPNRHYDQPLSIRGGLINTAFGAAAEPVDMAMDMKSPGRYTQVTAQTVGQSP